MDGSASVSGAIGTRLSRASYSALAMRAAESSAAMFNLLPSNAGPRRLSSSGHEHAGAGHSQRRAGHVREPGLLEGGAPLFLRWQPHPHRTRVQVGEEGAESPLAW